MKLAVVVATYNRLARLRQALESIAAQTSVPHEVVVVDGGSTDGTREHLAERGDVRAVLQDELLGLPHAYNSVWRELDCDYTAWLSDDTELVAPGLDIAVGVLEADPGVGMVGLKMRDAVESAEDFAGGVSPYGILNCNHGVLRLGLLRRVGYFHEGYPAYGVDPDLTAAVLSTGAKIVMTRPVVIRHHRETPVRAEERRSVEVDAAENPARKLYRERFRYLEGVPRRWAPRLARSRREREVIANARFISRFDPIRSFGRSVHLEQRIPERLLRSPDNPYR